MLDSARDKISILVTQHASLDVGALPWDQSGPGPKFADMSVAVVHPVGGQSHAYSVWVGHNIDTCIPDTWLVSAAIAGFQWVTLFSRLQLRYCTVMAIMALSSCSAVPHKCTCYHQTTEHTLASAC
jgi:hypothetical protein